MSDRIRPADRIPLREKIGYALGDSAFNLYWKSFEFFLVFFYTDVFGISAAAVGSMLLLTRIGDAAVDLLVGSVADRTQTRWGNFRPYFLWGAIPLAMAGVLTFTTPSVSPAARLLYAYLTYSLLMFIYSAVNVPYAALLGVMTSSSVERTSISSIRFIGSFSAGLFVQYFTLRFVHIFGQGNQARGWQLTIGLYGVLAVLLLWFCFASTHERVLAPPRKKVSIKHEFLDLCGSRAWKVLVGMQLLSQAAFTIRGSASTYYFKYFVKREDLLGLFLVMNGLAFLAAVSITFLLVRWVGKKRLLMGALGVGGIVIGLTSLAGPANIQLMFALQIVSSFIVGFKSPLIIAMFADTADQNEMRLGRRATGLIFASAVFATNLGVAIGAWCFGLILAHFGYTPNVAQASGSLHGIILSMGWVPCGMLILACTVLACYPLSDSGMVKVEQELRARREALDA